MSWNVGLLNCTVVTRVEFHRVDDHRAAGAIAPSALREAAVIQDFQHPSAVGIKFDFDRPERAVLDPVFRPAVDRRRGRRAQIEMPAVARLTFGVGDRFVARKSAAVVDREVDVSTSPIRPGRRAAAAWKFARWISPRDRKTTDSGHPAAPSFPRRAAVRHNAPDCGTDRWFCPPWSRP